MPLKINRIRAEDRGTIGALLFAALTPALLWKRARAIHLVLGGAGIGSAIGSSVHLWKAYTEREGIPAPVITPGPIVPPAGTSEGPKPTSS